MLETSFLASLLIMKPVAEASLAPDASLSEPEGDPLVPIAPLLPEGAALLPDVPPLAPWPLAPLPPDKEPLLPDAPLLTPAPVIEVIPGLGLELEPLAPPKLGVEHMPEPMFESVSEPLLELLPEADSLQGMPVLNTESIVGAAVELAASVDTIQGANAGQLTVTIVAAVTANVLSTVAKTVELGQ